MGSFGSAPSSSELLEVLLLLLLLLLLATAAAVGATAAAAAVGATAAAAVGAAAATAAATAAMGVESLCLPLDVLESLRQSDSSADFHQPTSCARRCRDACPACEVPVQVPPHRIHAGP